MLVNPLRELWERSEQNMDWLRRGMSTVFAGTMREDFDALSALTLGMRRLRRDRQLLLADRE